MRFQQVFPNFKGLRQGDSPSRYIFFCFHESSSYLVPKADQKRLINGFKARGRGREGIQVHYHFFTDGTHICEARVG